MNSDERAHHEIVHVCNGSEISCSLHNGERCFQKCLAFKVASKHAKQSNC